MNRIGSTPDGGPHGLPPVLNTGARTDGRRRRWWSGLLRWLERSLLLTTILAFGIVGFDIGRAKSDEIFARRALVSLRTHEAAEASGAAADERRPLRAATLPAGDAGRSESSRPSPRSSGGPSDRMLVGELQIPRIDLSTMVYDVRDAAALRHAAGHVRGTSLPWQPGNSALAGHRDSAFRQLRYVRPGDDVRVVTPYGSFHYRVTRAFVVRSDEVWVLEADAAALTLITCFPFRWVGSAPERWIVQAGRVAS